MFKALRERLRAAGAKFSGKTIHAAKGLESKVVFILGLHGGQGGFPDIWMSDRIYQVLKEKNYDLLKEEERRLFYVGLTRAKDRLYLISQKGNPSSFIEELPSQYISRQTTELAPIVQSINLCERCDREQQPDFKYCPYCGRPSQAIIEEYEDIMDDMDNLEEQPYYSDILHFIDSIEFEAGITFIARYLIGDPDLDLNTIEADHSYYGMFEGHELTWTKSILSDMLEQGFIEQYKGTYRGRPMIRISQSNTQQLRR